MAPSLPNRAIRITSNAPAAIAVVVAQGDMIHDWLLQNWESHRPGSKPELEIDQIRYGTLYPHGKAAPGEAVVLCRTGEDEVEIHCHGGETAADNIVAGLGRAGFVREPATRYLQTQFPDPISQQAAEDLLLCQSTLTAAILLDQMRGALRRKFELIQDLIDREKTDEAEKESRELAQWRSLGAHLIHPWKVTLAGPPNAGKSSLLNALLGYERAIVHRAAGTTRDRIHEGTSIGGWPIELIDSAGVRDTGDEIERVGVARSLDAIAETDLLVLLVPADQGWSSEHDRIVQKAGDAKRLIVRTKSDLVGEDGSETNDRKPIPVSLIETCVVETSVHDLSSIERLLERIASILVPVKPPPGSAIPFREEHFLEIEAWGQRL